MKKIVLLLIVVVSSLVMIGCTKEKTSYLHQLTYNELKEKIDNKESFPLLIKKKDCVYCEYFQPKIEEVTDAYQIDVYYIMINELTEDEYNALKELVPNFTGTPTTTFFKNGEEIGLWARIDGNQSKNIIIARFKATGYILEDNKSEE